MDFWSANWVWLLPGLAVEDHGAVNRNESPAPRSRDAERMPHSRHRGC